MRFCPCRTDNITYTLHNHPLMKHQHMDHYIELLLQRWQTATLTDYAHCVIAIILIGWFISKTSR